MIIKEFEGGIHSIEDLHKKFNNTIVFARALPETPPRSYYIRSIEGDRVYYRLDIHTHNVVGAVDLFDLQEYRPKTGIYNIVCDKRHTKVLSRPVMLVRLPYRQWRFGINSDNIQLLGINQKTYNPFDDIPVDKYDAMFKPSYPTFEDALNLLLERKVKHIAIDSKISMMLGKNRIIVFKKFVPFMAYKSGIPFTINEILPFVKDEYEKYSTLLSHAIGSHSIK